MCACKRAFSAFLRSCRPSPVPESGTIFYIFPQVNGNLTVSLPFSTTSCRKRCYGKHTRRCSGDVSSPAQAPSSVAGAAGPPYNRIAGPPCCEIKKEAHAMAEAPHTAPTATELDRSAEALYRSLPPNDREKVRIFLASLRGISCNLPRSAYLRN